MIQQFRTFRNPLLTAGLAAAIAAFAGAAAPAMAQPVDCVCASTFSVGDRVVLLVDDPTGATGLPAGSTGTVVCGQAQFPGIEILVRWDNWSDGDAVNTDFCECPGVASGSLSDWYVGCADIEIDVTVSNTTQGTMHATLQDALDNATSGDTIAIAAGTLFEDNIVFPLDLDVTITGAGMDQTFIDGGGASNPDNPILLITTAGGALADSTVAISHLTLQNGHNGGGPGGVSVGDGFDAEFSRVAFRDNTGSSGAHMQINAFGTFATIRDCVFTDGSGFDAIITGGESLLLTNCLFYGNNTTDSAIWTASSAGTASNPVTTIVNCTIDHPIASAAHAEGALARVNLINSALIGTLTGGGTMTTSHCLSTSVPAGSGNIVASPTFVDAANGDYRLAPGSLGIDAADQDAYLASGGGTADLGDAWRYQDDAGTPNTGVGPFAALDMGAYESQDQSPTVGCPADQNFDGMLSPADFNAWIFNYNAGCP